MKIKHLTFLLSGLLILGFAGFWIFKKLNFNSKYTAGQQIDYIVGQQIDSLNGVFVFYNGRVGNVSGRNLTNDGYNLGLKYQCVEFVKRYYYEHLDHKMPDSYEHAKDFFDKTLADGKENIIRNLTQYTNPSQAMPKVDDLLIFDGTSYNQYGHVAIISGVKDNEIEIIQQNPGQYSKSRATFALAKIDGKWKIKGNHILGWLRKN